MRLSFGIIVKYITKENVGMLVFYEEFIEFLEKLAEEVEIFVPIEENEEIVLKRWRKAENDGMPVLGKYRPVDPLKILLFQPRNDVLTGLESKERILLGVKNCDLSAIQLLDRALLEGDFVGPVYKEFRERTLIISSDCTEAKSSCHCVLQGINPYPEEYYDVSSSSIGERLLLRAGNEKGERFLKLVAEKLRTFEEIPGVMDVLENQREKTRDLVKQINSQWSLGSKDASEKLNIFDAKVVDSCIECGGCNFVCPTCYCFIMNDESVNESFSKVRTWDSCQLKGYARVAGGGNPRADLYKRFNHRYSCKFNYMVKQFDMSSCTGCGRCIDVCPAGIDIRNTMRVMREEMKVEK